ncbi:MAG: BatD family protein [Gammaproteobacteria bacterium]
MNRVKRFTGAADSLSPLSERVSMAVSGILWLTLWFGTGTAFAADIDVSLDRNPVELNESFQLVFSASETPDGDPDFTVLERDFEILNRSQSSNVSLINGSFSKTVQWTLTVMAKRSGDVTVPAVSFGADKSAPLTVTVTEGDSATTTRSDDELFVEVEAKPSDPYVQAQVLYKVRVYSRVSIAQGNLSEPEADDTLIEKLGDAKQFTTQRNGVAYQVTENDYVLFPQKSGTLTIPPLKLNAQVITSGQPSFSGFFSRRMTKLKRAVSKAVILNVKPVPGDYRGKHWLPAEGLSLGQEWSGDFTRMKVGEPLTRTLTLVAKGATVGQLPELASADTVDSLKRYPDQPVLKEDKKAEGLVAFRQEKIAFIPSAAGRYTLPAIEIPWFNVRTGQNELAVIPATDIEVLPSAEASPEPMAVAPTPAPIIENPKAETVAPVVKTETNPIWMWLALFLGAGWLATLVVVWVNRASKPKDPEADPVQTSLKQCSRDLKKACERNDAAAAKDALIVWGRLQYGVSSLGALAPYCEARLRDQILLLSRSLYGNEAGDWQGKPLFQAFVENKARQGLKKDADDGLEPLYRQ